MEKWAGSPISGGLTSYFVHFLRLMIRSDDDMDSSSEGTSVEVVSPPRRPVTRSVSAKRAAEEIEDGEDLSISSPPRPKKARKVTREPGEFSHLPLAASC